MKIAYKLLLVAILSAAAIALLGLFLYFSIRSFDLAMEKNRATNQIAVGAFDRRLILDEYLLYGLERSKQQWFAASAQLEGYFSFQSSLFVGKEETALIRNLVQNNSDSGKVFSQLVAIKESAGEGSEAVLKDQATRLASQLLIKSQDIILTTGKLATLSLRDAAYARRNIILLLIGFIAGLGLTITTVIMLLWRNMVRPIVKLREGTKIVAGGNLNYEVDIRNRDEIGELAASFNEMTRKLGEIDRAKTEFVSLASHQLKTPLTSIGWYTEMLLANVTRKMPKKEGKYLERISRNHHRMVELVNALLNVSRLEMGTLVVKPESLNIFEIADEVLEELLPSIKKGKIKVIKNYGKDVAGLTADRQLVRIILQNLFSNAVKYSPESGKVVLVIKKEVGEMLITVSDNGCGIPEAQQSEIFKKLFRADNAQQKDTDGSGLGLYIARAMTDRLGGRIWFESEENHGTTFHVSLPVMT